VNGVRKVINGTPFGFNVYKESRPIVAISSYCSGSHFQEVNRDPGGCMSTDVCKQSWLTDFWHIQNISVKIADEIKCKVLCISYDVLCS